MDEGDTSRLMEDEDEGTATRAKAEDEDKGPLKGPCLILVIE
jgi:hypothetical protein